MSLELFELLNHKDLNNIFEKYIFVCDRCKIYNDRYYTKMGSYCFYDEYDASSSSIEDICYKCYCIKSWW